jgi:hypothetical protein
VGEVAGSAGRASLGRFDFTLLAYPLIQQPFTPCLTLMRALPRLAGGLQALPGGLQALPHGTSVVAHSQGRNFGVYSVAMQ